MKKSPDPPVAPTDVFATRIHASDFYTSVWFKRHHGMATMTELHILRGLAGDWELDTGEAWCITQSGPSSSWGPGGWRLYTGEAPVWHRVVPVALEDLRTVDSTLVRPMYDTERSQWLWRNGAWREQHPTISARVVPVSDHSLTLTCCLKYILLLHLA